MLEHVVTHIKHATLFMVSA